MNQTRNLIFFLAISLFFSITGLASDVTTTQKDIQKNKESKESPYSEKKNRKAYAFTSF